MDYSLAVVIWVRVVRFQFNNPWFTLLAEYWLNFLFKLSFTWFDRFLSWNNLMIYSKVRNKIVMRPSRITLEISLLSTIIKIMPRSTLNRFWSVFLLSQMDYSFTIVIIVLIVRFQFNNPWFMLLAEYWLNFLFKLSFTWFDRFLSWNNFMIYSEIRNFIIMRPNRVTLKISLFSSIIEVMPRGTFNRPWSILRIRFG
jgi:hypothetical protein